MANPKILVLLDRVPGQLLGTVDSFGLSFAKPDATDLYYFSLSHILSKLQAQVVKAHRQTDPASDKGGPTPADIENFRFSAATLAGLDEVWLIGYNSVRPGDVGLTPAEKASILDDNELAALTTFMNDGGGVFAAGDHTGLGLSLAGNVPRVRTMRKWWYPTPGPFGNEPIAPEAQQSHGRQRFDTTRPGHIDATLPTNPGVPAVWFDDQSDDVPQYIVPETGKNLCYEPFVYEFNPGLLHPLLQGSGGPIFAFADHMHEGEVILPYEYNRVFDYAGLKFEEYPSGPHGQVKPQIIAWSSTNGAASVVPPSEMGVHVGDDNISAFNFFAAIGAYDGSIAGVGRVVVESTFHHCLDINLIGDPQAPAGDPKRQGFLASPQGQSILSGIEDYYNNIVSWLAPAHFAPKKWVGAVVQAIGIQPLRDVVRTPPPDSATRLGAIAVASLKSTVRQGILMTWLRAILPDGIAKNLPALPWGPVSGTPGCGSVNQQGLLHAALGHAVITAAALGRSQGNHTLSSDAEAQRQILAATVRGVTSLWEDLARRGEAMSRLAHALREHEEHQSRTT
jgi:hypothetical protein